VIVINFSLSGNEQGVFSLCEEIDRKRLRNFFPIVYLLSVVLALSTLSSCAKPELAHAKRTDP